MKNTYNLRVYPIKNILQFLLMTAQLSAEQQLKFSNIMFQSEGRQHQEIQNLTPQQKSKLKSIYAQKIAYETVNAHIKPQQVSNETQYNKTAAPGIIGTVCCCFMPEQNRDKFDITSSVFIKRILSTFLFFKSDFLKIDDGKSQLYGFLWLTITYVVILGLSANLNEYFIMPNAYKFNNYLMLRAVGISAVFLISQPFIYAAVVKCLNGYISTVESMMLCGYSTILYFIPTILCLLPSLYWHVCLLAAGSIFRNYSSKIPSKSFAILIVILIIEALFVFTLLRVMFLNDNGYNFSDGTNKVFNHQSMRVFAK